MVQRYSEKKRHLQRNTKEKRNENKRGHIQLSCWVTACDCPGACQVYRGLHVLDTLDIKVRHGATNLNPNCRAIGCREFREETKVDPLFAGSPTSDPRERTPWRITCQLRNHRPRTIGGDFVGETAERQLVVRSLTTSSRPWQQDFAFDAPPLNCSCRTQIALEKKQPFTSSADYRTRSYETCVPHESAQKKSDAMPSVTFWRDWDICRTSINVANSIKAEQKL